MSDIPSGSFSTRAPLENLTSDAVRLIRRYLKRESPMYSTAIILDESDISYKLSCDKIYQVVLRFKSDILYTLLGLCVHRQVN